ncbi:unnamed protein product [Closterium sp. NIES-65]|nr:unnamed protein product [Closterium sp. NIES-65]
MPAVVTVSIGGGSGLGMGETGSAVGSAWVNAGSAREPAGWVKARGSTVAAATAVSLAGDGSNLYSDVSNLGEPIAEQDVLTQQQQGKKSGAAAAAAAAGGKGSVDKGREVRDDGESEGGREMVGLEGVLERMRRAVRIESLAEGAHVHVTGVQSLMGMEGTWQLLVSPAGGRFVESFVGRHIWSVSGFAGQSDTSESDTESSASSSSSSDLISDSSSDSLSDDALEDSVCRPEIQSTVWDVDTAGRVSSLDLDDHEVYLLSVWLRSSLWLLPPVASSALEIRAVGGEEEIGEGGLVVGIPNGMRMEIDAHVAADDRVILAINLIGREVIMYVAVHRSDWLPRVAVVKAYGALETFTFTQWAPVAPDCPFLLPATVHRSTSAGAQQSFSSARTSLLPPGPAHILLHEKEASDSEFNEASEEASPFSFSYDIPGSQTVPSPLSCFPEASFDESAPAEVELFQSNSGHLLVRPRINGQDVGAQPTTHHPSLSHLSLLPHTPCPACSYFILDSGASCFTIEPAVADGLGLSSFGCVHTVTVHGPAECAFRRADSVQLGPLSIANALFVDVSETTVAHGEMSVMRHGCVHTVTVHGPAECAFRRADSAQLGPLSIDNALFVYVGGAALVQGVKPAVGIYGYAGGRSSAGAGVEAGGGDLRLRCVQTRRCARAGEKACEGCEGHARGRQGILRLYKPQETPDAPKASSNATAGSTENGRSGEADRSETGLVQSAAAFADGSAANAPVPPGVAMAQRRGRGGARGGGGAGGRAGGGVAVVSAALVGGHPSMPDLGENIYWEPLRMLGSVPHIAISFQEHWDSPPTYCVPSHPPLASRTPLSIYACWAACLTSPSPSKSTGTRLPTPASSPRHGSSRGGHNIQHSLCHLVPPNPFLLLSPLTTPLPPSHPHQPLRMLGSVPHIAISFQEHWDSPPQSGLFLLDTGAGGVDIIFNALFCHLFPPNPFLLLSPLTTPLPPSHPHQPLRMLGSVPHIAISFQEHWDSPPHSGLFLLDTGAAGVDIIFNARAVERCQLGRRAKGGDSWLKGMGGAGGGGGGGQQMTVTLIGAAGVDIIFNARAVERCQLGRRAKGGDSWLKGMGGAGGRGGGGQQMTLSVLTALTPSLPATRSHPMQERQGNLAVVRQGNLAVVTVAGQQLKNVSALFS